MTEPFTPSTIPARSYKVASSLNLEGKVEDYNYELDSSAGSVEIGEDIDLGGLSTEKSIDNGSKRTIEISNGAGSVEIRFH